MINPEKFDVILARYEGQPASLIPVLQDIQDEFNYLPKEELQAVAQRLQVPLTQVYSVVTFFKMFSLIPKGRHLIRICLGTACHLRGGVRLAESFSRRLGIDIEGTTDDFQFSLETVRCLGSCTQAPVAMVDQRYFGQLSVDQVPKVLRRYEKPKAEI
jgi:NADH-quinone oxidoreductase subunit E